MANDIWVISDSHWGHANILSFTGHDGKPLRPEFNSLNHMDEFMIEAWNSVVKPNDKVYHLGDVALKDDKAIKHVGRCHGNKNLILGNHDNGLMRIYAPYFQKVYSTRLLDKVLMSHIPIHRLSFGKALVNVHGHVHNNVTEDHFGKEYYNVSCEVLGYVPINFEILKQKAFKRLEEQ